MSVEAEVRRRMRNTKMQRAVLTAVQLAGVLAWIAIAPNTLRLLKIKSRWSSKSARSATRRLVSKGYLKESAGGLILTAKGIRFLNEIPPHPKHWDHKWRVVIFDIPENRKRKRDMLRHKLGQIGFIRLQNSVWVYPYDCEELLVLLKKDFQLGKEVVYLVADSIERSGHLTRRFGLA